MTQKLPKELESTRKAVKGLQQVTGQQALTQVNKLAKEMHTRGCPRNIPSKLRSDTIS